MHQSSEAILLIDGNFQILEANPISKVLLKWPDGDSTSHSLKSLLVFDSYLDEYTLRENSRNAATLEYHCKRHDGVHMEIELSASLVTDPDITAFSLILRDVYRSQGIRKSA